MEKLTIEHLAPYLPYGLKLAVITKYGYIMSSIHRLNHGEGIGTIKHILTSKKYKPILRPLSDLQSVINDKILINEHTINKLIQDKHFVEYGVFSHYRKMLDIELDGDPSLQYDKNKSISLYVVLDIYNELLKGHYDIFELIDKGLAIDVNTL